MLTTNDFIKKFSGRKPGIQGSSGLFSVLVPVADINGEAHILYEKRSSFINRQPGEVCFPGGAIEQGEDPLQAALRETWEETGIYAGHIDIIAELDTFHPPSNIVIYPFLAKIRSEGISGIKINKDEVDECFFVPVSFLLNEPYTYEYDFKTDIGDDFRYDKIGLKEPLYNWRKMHHKIISWEYEGRYIWGLTALITKWTLDILLDK